MLVIKNASNIFFTSDTHFGHKNIIEFCNRPFSSVEDMNNKLIQNWNSIVKPEDIVFHLGDFAFGSSAVWNSILDRLNGKIYLILGNHDVKNLKQEVKNRFEGIHEQLLLNVGGRLVYLNHYPFLCYGGTYRNKSTAIYQLYGHVHSCPNSTGLDSDRLEYTFPWQYDVGVDNNKYKPVSWHTVNSIIQKQAELEDFNIMDILLKHIKHSLKDVHSYDELTSEEKEIISPNDFNKLITYLKSK